MRYGLLRLLFLFPFVAVVQLHAETTGEVEKFARISAKMQENLRHIQDYKTSKVIFLVREHRPQSQQKIDEANALVEKQMQTLKKNREEYIKENGASRVVDDETFQKEMEKSRAWFLASLTSSERVSLCAYYYRDGKVREEELKFTDTRPLSEIRTALYRDPDSVTGQINYDINDKSYHSSWGIGTGPLETQQENRDEYSASVILDKAQAVGIRSKAELGSVSNASPENLQFLKFGNDAISPKDFSLLIRKTKMPVSLSESLEKGEKTLKCLLGKRGKDQALYEIILFPEKNYAIKSMKLFYNNFVTLDYEFSDYIEANPGVWTPKHIILKNRELGDDVEDAFHVTEFLAVEPMQPGIALDDSLFEINLSDDEKKLLTKQDEIQINRKTSERPPASKEASPSDTYWRVAMFLVGAILVVISIYCRTRRKPI